MLIGGAQQYDISDVDGIVAGVSETGGDQGSPAFVDQEVHTPVRNESSRSTLIRSNRIAGRIVS